MVENNPQSNNPKDIAAERSLGWDPKLKCEDLLEYTNDMVQFFSPEGTLLEVNRAWREMLEYSKDSAAHLSIFSVIHPQSKPACQAIFEKALTEGIPQRLQTLFVSKAGDEIAVEGTVLAVSKPNGEKILRAILHDVTRPRQYEDLKNEFISAVSHELRTPLTVVREGVAQLQDGLVGEVTADQSSLLDIVLQNVDRLNRIIGELLDVSKLEAGQVRIRRSLCDIVEVVKEAAANFQVIAQQKGIHLSVETSQEAIETYFDRDKFIQILTNLLSNAFKFTQQGHVKLAVRKLENLVECKVSDTGKGISGEDLSKMFEKFHLSKQPNDLARQGAGLGLAICKKLIELHHGKISVESLPGQGTVVTIMLPIYAPREIFREHIAQGLTRCVEEGGTLSLILLDIVDFEIHQSAFGPHEMRGLMVKVEKLINDCLRRGADIAIKDTKTILVLLPDTTKENAHIVLGRLSQILEDFFAQNQKNSQIKTRSSIASFPEDAQTIDAIIDKIYD